LLDAAQARIRQQFKEAREEVFEITKDIPPEEIEKMVQEAVIKCGDCFR